MSDFLRQALETQINANLRDVLAAGFDVVVASNEAVVALNVVPRAALPALPGPGDGSGDDAETEVKSKRTPAKHKSTASGRSCRFCRRQLRGDNATGVCSAYGCRKQLEKEQTKKPEDNDAGK